MSVQSQAAQGLDEWIAGTACADQMVGVGQVVRHLLDAWRQTPNLGLSIDGLGDLDVRSGDAGDIFDGAVAEQYTQEIRIDRRRILLGEICRDTEQLVQVTEGR